MYKVTQQVGDVVKYQGQMWTVEKVDEGIYGGRKLTLAREGETIVRFECRDGYLRAYNRGDKKIGDVFGQRRERRYLVLDIRYGPRGGKQHLLKWVEVDGVEPPYRFLGQPTCWVCMTGMEMVFLPR